MSTALARIPAGPIDPTPDEFRIAMRNLAAGVSGHLGDHSCLLALGVAHSAGLARAAGSTNINSLFSASLVSAGLVPGFAAGGIWFVVFQEEYSFGP